jgi:hypothetical protein
MCYGNPQQMLADILNLRRLEPDRYGHTALDNFEHFCAYAGCDPAKVGSDAFAWAKLAYIAAQLPPAKEPPETTDDVGSSDDRRHASGCV